MNNADIWASIRNIASCGFLPEGLQTLDENVIRSDNGIIFVIDCDIRINTPSLREGGTRPLTTDISWSEFK